MTVQFSAIASTMTDVCEKFVTMVWDPVTAPSRITLNPVGACSRWRQHIQHPIKLTHRHREQARSHKGLVVGMDIGFTRDQGGSELAREDGSTSDIHAI
ncbi:hypothetical protein LOY67_03180 [Pseudomonas sp. B21-056]|jgi:hypothetical protein|uniref:hypothetical protein n=1 Tax=Pseudomonas sp. B21-056 TaxID=2895495 RepID=UPI002230CA58|nr:hypothetical protein [Pseudomonas sp. B21-056]UZE24435.1 hypothetical protein LOY67_03180 [Pseudomonas sp. B21-056]